MCLNNRIYAKQPVSSRIDIFNRSKRSIDNAFENCHSPGFHPVFSANSESCFQSCFQTSLSRESYKIQMASVARRVTETRRDVGSIFRAIEQRHDATRRDAILRRGLEDSGAVPGCRTSLLKGHGTPRRANDKIRIIIPAARAPGCRNASQNAEHDHRIRVRELI